MLLSFQIEKPFHSFIFIKFKTYLCESILAFNQKEVDRLTIKAKFFIQTESLSNQLLDRESPFLYYRLDQKDQKFHISVS